MLKNIIPREFYIEDDGPVCACTVGELIAELKRLPQDIPIHLGYESGVQLRVYNILSDDECFLEIKDPL